MSIKKQKNNSQFKSLQEKNFEGIVRNNYRKCHEFIRLYGFVYFPRVTDSKKIKKAKEGKKYK